MGLMPELGENSQNSLEKLSLEKTLKSQIYNGIPGNKESKITPAIRSQIISHIWKKGIQSWLHEAYGNCNIHKNKKEITVMKKQKINK